MRMVLLPVLILALAPDCMSQPRSAVGVAPAAIRGSGVPSDAAMFLGRVVAEALSWELSAAPGMRVNDPDDLRAAFEALWRDGIDAEELQTAQDLRSRLALDVVMIPDVFVEAGRAVVTVGVATSSVALPVVTASTEGHDAEVLPLMRRSLMRLVDSLGLKFPGELVSRWKSLPGAPFDALVSWADGMRLADEKRYPEALDRLREASRQGATSIPAFLVSLRRLESRTGEHRRPR